jgi:hypothetical protein
MKIHILTTTFLISTFFSFAQEKKLLQTYTYRIDRYKAINFVIGANGRKNNNYDFNNSNDASISGRFNANLFTTKSTDNLIQTISTGLGTSAVSSKNESLSNKNKSRNLNVSSFVFINNKWYQKNNFFEVGVGLVDAYSTYSANNDVQMAQNKLSNNNFLSSHFTLGIGKGRLENITDMQNVIWLHNILLKDGNLNRKLTEVEIIELARTITSSNNRRILDGRKRIQFILKNIDRYLQDIVVINKTDINYFSNLNDVVFFANNAARQSGTEQYIRVTPVFLNYALKEENRNTPTTKSLQNENGAEIVLKIGVQKFKPLSLKHQIAYGVAAKGNYGKSNIGIKNYTNSNLDYAFAYDTKWKKIGIDYFIRYSIVPNTRTTIDLSLQAENGYQSLNKQKELFHTAVMAANASYFISYNTRFNINLGTTYNKNNFDIRASNRYNPSNLDAHNLSLFFNTSLDIAL